MPCACVLSHSVMSDSVQLLWTVAHQAPLSMGFSRQVYWNELPFLSSGDLPKSGIKPETPALAGGFFTTEPTGKPQGKYMSLSPPFYSLKKPSYSFLPSPSPLP